MRDRLTHRLTVRRLPRPLRPLARNPLARRLIPPLARRHLRRRTRDDPMPPVH